MRGARLAPVEEKQTQRLDARDLAVDEVLPQQVALAETYVQVWERREADVAPRRAEEEDAFGLGDLGGDDAMET